MDTKHSDQKIACPNCCEAPTVTCHENTLWVIECILHGHMAAGDSLEAAIKHWKLYTEFMSKEAQS
jgi:hypothetical protein